VRVLITVGALGPIGGAQAYVRDLAVWLLRQGHLPVVYGPEHGRTAAQLARLTIPVTDDLSTLGVAPDLIHGNSAVETMTALMHFTKTPAIFVCHGWRPDITGAPGFPRILHYVAVDDTCADRLLCKESVPPEKLTVLLNGVDTARFPPRAVPLPARPARALVFGNAAHAAGHAAIVEEACRRAGIALDVVGEFAGTAVDAPETMLRNYDLVFAKAKCALEGMASGAAVIVCEGSGLGGLVTTQNLERLRRLNFGIRTLMLTALTVESVSREIAAYDASDATAVAATIRATATADTLHEQLLQLYESVLEEHRRKEPEGWEAESHAAASFLRLLASERRPADANLNLVVQAAHRVLRAPIVGPTLTRVARWIVNRGKEGGRL